MAPLYKDMYSGRGTLQQIHARDWRRFLDALSPDAVVQRQPLGMWLTTGAQLTEVGSQKIHSKADVPRVVSSAKPQWVRMSDPMRNEIHLRNESRAALRWLSSCFSHDQLRLVRQAPQLHCMAAADAMAEGSTVGVGGWISASQSFAWFSEQWDMTEVRKHWALAPTHQECASIHRMLRDPGPACSRNDCGGAHAHQTLSLHLASGFGQHLRRIRHQPPFHNYRTAQQFPADSCRVVSPCQRAPRTYTPRRGKECLGRRAQPQPRRKISAPRARAGAHLPL